MLVSDAVRVRTFQMLGRVGMFGPGKVIGGKRACFAVGSPGAAHLSDSFGAERGHERVRRRGAWRSFAGERPRCSSWSRYARTVPGIGAPGPTSAPTNAHYGGRRRRRSRASAPRPAGARPRQPARRGSRNQRRSRRASSAGPAMDGVCRSTGACWCARSRSAARRSAGDSRATRACTAQKHERDVVGRSSSIAAMFPCSASTRLPSPTGHSLVGTPNPRSRAA